MAGMGTDTGYREGERDLASALCLLTPVSCYPEGEPQRARRTGRLVTPEVLNTEEAEDVEARYHGGASREGARTRSALPREGPRITGMGTDAGYREREPQRAQRARRWLVTAACYHED
jgi:hypothetical protein